MLGKVLFWLTQAIRNLSCLHSEIEVVSICAKIRSDILAARYSLHIIGLVVLCLHTTPRDTAQL